MIKVAIVDDNQINRITIKEKLAPYQDGTFQYSKPQMVKIFLKN